MAERRIGRVVLIIVALVVVLPIAALAVLAATFDPNRYKPQIIEAVKRATGRDLALNGPITMKLSLSPTLAATDVALANIEGGSRPQMVALHRLEAQVSLLPLLRHRLQIDRLVLLHPDILLETDAQGSPNWRFGPSVPSQPLPSAPVAHASAAPPPEIAVREVLIEDGTLTYRNGRTGRTKTLAIPRLEARADGLDSPVKLTAQAAYNNAPFAADAEVGSLARLQDPGAASPWPVRLTLSSGGAKLTLAGGLTRPLQGRGYSLRLDGAAPDLAALQAFYPRAMLPPLRDVSIGAQIADSGERIPIVSSLTLHAGASDLSAYAAGLTLSRLEVAAPSLEQPLHVAADGMFAGTPLTVQATTAPPSFIISGGAPLTLDASAGAAGAQLSAKGGIGDPLHLAGLDLRVAGDIPDLAALSPLARRSLPPLRQIAFQGRFAEGPGGLGKSVVLRDAKLSLPQGDASGQMALTFGQPAAVTGSLTASRVDVDALLGVLKSPAGQAAPPPAPPDQAASPPQSPQPAAAPQPAPPRRVIPDAPLPFGDLRRMDADVTAQIGTLTLGGIDYRDVSGHVSLRSGKLDVDPLTAELPGGRVSGRFSADASQPSPPVAVVLRAPAVGLPFLLRAAGLPADASGAVQVDADLRSAGQTPRSLAAHLDGHVGLAMVDAEIDNRVIAATLGEALRRANLPDPGTRGGRSAVRCFALRLDAAAGVATVRALLLDTTILHLAGSGSVNLGDETLALRLEPLARLGSTGVMVPLRVSGSFANPRAVIDAAGAAGEAARLAEGEDGKGRRLGIIIGALAGDRMIAGGMPDNCAEQLAIARGGAPGPAPGPAIGGGGAGERPKPPKPVDLLRQFLR